MIGGTTVSALDKAAWSVQTYRAGVFSAGFCQAMSDRVRLRPFRLQDIPHALELVREVGWNQIEADLRFLVEGGPDGCWVAEADARVVGTVTTIRYEEGLGWIGMVIVDSGYRRRGIATRLMEQAVGYLKDLSIKLDATEKGAAVYRQMGFAVECPVERWLRPAGPLPTHSSPSAATRPLETDDLKALVELDRPAFGASRRDLLSWYLGHGLPARIAPGRGYVVGRPGHWATQMGPLVAGDVDTARELMTAFLEGLSAETMIADVPRNHPAAELLGELGFRRQRSLLRMIRGRNVQASSPEHVFCLSGFEFG